jgi:hypothetical protein
MPDPSLRSGRYTLMSPLRTGGSGVIWRGVDTRDGAIVALKAIPVAAGGAEAVAHEAEAVRRVQHPGVLQIQAAFVEGDHGYLVMAVAACSLADVLDVHGPLPAPIALAIVLFLCDVLDAAHTAGVVHRDVKPPNILVLPSGEVRLADWGIARVHASAHGVTRTGAMLGTLAFMAPEQRRDPRDVRPATDVYALAATLALALTGRAPGELYVPEVLAELRQAVPGGVADAIAAAGRYAPTERVPTPRAFAAALAASGEPIASPAEAQAWLRAHAPTVDRSVPTPQGRRWVLGAGLAALAVALAGGVGWWRGEARGRAVATADPASALPRCADAASQWATQTHFDPVVTVGGDVGDVDGDGLLDVMFANASTETVTVWWGERTGRPNAHTVIATGPVSGAPAITDIDGDGHRDLIVPAEKPARIHIVRGLGERTFAPPQSDLQDPPPRGIAARDVTGDGHPDLAIINHRDVTVYFRRGNASGAPFAAQEHALELTDGWRAAQALNDEAGLWVWLLRDREVGRARIDEHGAAGPIEVVNLPATPLEVLRDATHPGAAVVLVAGRVDAWLVRVAPGSAICTLGQSDSHASVHAVTDFEGDGVADLVESMSCEFCDTNYRFLHGVR